jgi:hypothetical protein
MPADGLVADMVSSVQSVTHRETWRGEPYVLSYLLLREDPAPGDLLAVYRWAVAEGLANPRAVTPSFLTWSSLFQPTLHAAVSRCAGMSAAPSIRFAGGAPRGCADQAELRTFWLQSVVFLAAVTLSAAIIQGRWSRGTVESKFDRLWQAATSSALPDAIDGFALRADVAQLSSAEIPSIDLLLAIRARFMALVRALSDGVLAEPVRAVARGAMDDGRFGFAAWLAGWLPGLTGVVVYGSSVAGADYADIDAVLVVDDADAVLRLLENRRLEWGGKELNVGVYTADELWRMQLLSGDNLADYGVCVHGEVMLPHKSVATLLARNVSFGMVRQRQQLGMLARALADGADALDDRRNLHHYFVKIPSNVAKGTFGAVGRRRTKREVNDWLKATAGFDTELAQRAVLADGPIAPLAASALATMGALRELNAELGIVEAQEQEVIA